MGRPFVIVYGDADVGSAIQDIETVISKIKSNKATNKDFVKLIEANSELLKAVLSNENEN